MGYITRKSNDKLKADFTKFEGDPTWLGDLMGLCYHDVWYFQMEAWCSFIDSVLPDWFPLGTVQSLFIEIVKFVYNVMAQHHYNIGAQIGKRIIGKFNEVIQDYKNKISEAIDEAKRRVDAEIITPLRNMVNNELKPKVDALKTELSDIETKARDALNNANSAISTANDASQRARTALSQIKDASIYFNEQIKSLDAKASQIRNDLTTSESLLKTHEDRIKNLLDRVKALEDKVSAQATQQKGILERLGL